MLGLGATSYFMSNGFRGTCQGLISSVWCPAASTDAGRSMEAILRVDYTKLNPVGSAMNNFAESLDFNQILRLGAKFDARFGDCWSAIIPEAFPVSGGWESKFHIGAKRSFVPALGKTVWELPQTHAAWFPFSARIFQLDEGREIGYVRVPHYNYDESAVEEFAKLIGHFEEATEALVLDQVNNPGGSMLHMYAILSCLADRPLIPPKHELSLSEDDVAMASDTVELAEAGEAVPPEERPSPQEVAYSRFVLSEIEAGRGLGRGASKPTFLFGVSEILPAQNHYTKRIVVLINARSYSAAEFLAAILQDDKRATLFGQKTPGAGGCVKRVTVPGSEKFGIAYMTVTWTFARRTNGQPIENIGVHPDVSYEVTADDLRFGFRGYRHALLTAIDA